MKKSFLDATVTALKKDYIFGENYFKRECMQKRKTCPRTVQYSGAQVRLYV